MTAARSDACTFLTGQPFLPGRPLLTAHSFLPGILLFFPLLACSAPQSRQVRVIEVDLAHFEGIHYPKPHALPLASPSALQPPAALALDDHSTPTGDRAGVPEPFLEQIPDLRNAAVRDQETQDLARHYLLIGDQIHRVIRQMALLPETHLDTTPLHKMHSDLLGHFGILVEQAAALEGAYLDLARELNISVTGPVAGQDRDSRVALLFQMTACIRRDVSDRTRDGLAFLDARRQGVEMPEPDHTGDALIQQTAQLLLCARLASQTLGRP